MVEGMISSSISQQYQEKRACQRIEINRSVQVKFADGQIINGLIDEPGCLILVVIFTCPSISSLK